MSKNRKKSSETEAHPSRRAFVKSAMLGAGATAALGTTGVGVGAQETNGEGITIPPEFAAAKKASLPAVDFTEKLLDAPRAGAPETDEPSGAP